MSEVIIEVLGQELELAKGVGFGLNYAIDDVKNPEKKNSNYSKTITLAGSKSNNKLLGGLFDVNADFTFFNPNIKTEARIILDSSTVMDGFLQLKSIEKDNDNLQSGNKIIYKCIVMSKTSDFFGDIKNKDLNELDFNRFSHAYTQSNIAASWSHTPENVYMYPMLFKGSNTYVTSDFKPAIFHKAYLKRIAQEVGYTLGGSLMDESTVEGAAYAKEVIPFNGDLPIVSDAVIDSRKFKAGMTTTPVNLINNLTVDGGEALDGSITNVTFINNDSTGGNFDNGGNYNSTTNTYSPPNSGANGLNLDTDNELTITSKKTVQTITIGSGASSIYINFATPHGFVTGSLDGEIQGTANYNGVYTGITVESTTRLKVFVTYVADESVGTIGIDRSTSNNIGSDVRYYIKKNGSNWLFPSTTSFNTAPDLNVGNDWTVVNAFSSNLNFPSQFMLQSDSFTVDYFISPKGATNEIDSDYEGVSISIDTLTASLYNNPSSNVLTDDDIINLNEFIPKKIKQSDIITDLVKRYNAYISTDKDNDRKIIIDTRDSYYAKGVTLDWSDKKDYSSKDTITLLSELQNKEFEFTYKKDSDDYNKNYSLSVDGNIYGQKKVEFTNEFAKGKKKIETPFSPTPLIYNAPQNPVAIVSAISATAPSTNMRVLHFGGVIDTLNNGGWTFNYVSGGVSNSIIYNTYPYTGHFDNPITPTLDINFGEVPYLWYNELENRTNGNLYNRFWSNYINQIDNGKMVTSNYFLNSVDISFIKDNLNARIFVEDSYYIINKIVDYNPISVGVTKVELLKIDEGISFVHETIVEDNVRSFGDSYARIDNTGEDLTRNTVIAKDSAANGYDNVILSNSSIINGNNNIIGSGSDSSIITGNNNAIADNLVNSFIIGANGKTVTESNSGWIGGTEIVNGVISEPYKVYTFLISQTGTNIPTSIVLRDTLNGGVVFGRTTNGVYYIESDESFTTDKTFIIVTPNSVDYTTVEANVTSQSNIDLMVKNSNGDRSDSLLSNTSIEIRVYN